MTVTKQNISVLLSCSANKISFDSRLRNRLQSKRSYQFSETESSSWSVDRNEEGGGGGRRRMIMWNRYVPEDMSRKIR